MIDFLNQDVTVPLWFIILIFTYRGSISKLIKNRIPELKDKDDSER